MKLEKHINITVLGQVLSGKYARKNLSFAIVSLIRPHNVLFPRDNFAATTLLNGILNCSSSNNVKF